MGKCLGGEQLGLVRVAPGVDQHQRAAGRVGQKHFGEVAATDIHHRHLVPQVAQHMRKPFGKAALGLEAGDENPVVITTIHQSKGLQYENVYLFDLFDGNKRAGGFRVTDADEDESLESFKLLSFDDQPVVSLYFKKKQAQEDARR